MLQFGSPANDVSGAGECLYLRKGSRGLPDLPDHPQRDADHGGQGHEPANTVAPVRVGVHIVVLQRFVFDQEKQENPLQKTPQKSIWGRIKKTRVL